MLDQMEEYSLVKLRNTMPIPRRMTLGNNVGGLNEDGEELQDERDLWAQMDGVQPGYLFENMLYKDGMEIDEEPYRI